jgi:putative FmdB family regulatory protein
VQRRNVAIYEYECKTCESIVEISHPINNTPEIICISCSKPRTKKFSLSGTIFRGSGWGKDR